MARLPRVPVTRLPEVIGGIYIGVEEIFGGDGYGAVEEGAAPTGANADIVAHRRHLDPGEGGVRMPLPGDDADVLDDLVAIFKIQVQIEIGVHDHDAVGYRVFEGNNHFGGPIGLGRVVDGLELEDILGGLDPRPGGAVDRELLQGSGARLVGKAQANLAGQYRAAQGDIEIPLFERIVGVGLPRGRGIAVEREGGGLGAGAGFPNAAFDLAALLSRVVEEMGVAHGVYFSAEMDQVQFARFPYLDQVAGHGPGLPPTCAVEDK